MSLERYQKDKIHNIIDENIQIKVQLLSCNAVDLTDNMEFPGFVKDNIKCGHESGGAIEGMQRLLQHSKAYYRGDQLLTALEKIKKKQLADEIRADMNMTEQ